MASLGVLSAAIAVHPQWPKGFHVITFQSTSTLASCEDGQPWQPLGGPEGTLKPLKQV